MDIVIFTVMGAVLPFDTWVRYGKGSTKLWRTIVVGIFVMLFRRLPSVMLFSKGLRSISTFGQTMFVGVLVWLRPSKLYMIAHVWHRLVRPDRSWS